MSFYITLKHIELLKTYANGIFGNSLEKYIKTGNYSFNDIIYCRETENITYIHIDTFDIYNLILSEYILNGTKNLPSVMFSIVEGIDGSSKIYNIEYKMLSRKVAIVILDGKYISYTCNLPHSGNTDYYFFKNTSEYNYSRHSKSSNTNYYFFKSSSEYNYSSQTKSSVTYEAEYKLTKLGMYYIISEYENKETKPNIKFLLDSTYNIISYTSGELDTLNVVDSNRINYIYDNDLYVFTTTKGYNLFATSSVLNPNIMLYNIKNKHGIIKLILAYENNTTRILSYRKNNKLYLSDIG